MVLVAVSMATASTAPACATSSSAVMLVRFNNAIVVLDVSMVNVSMERVFVQENIPGPAVMSQHATMERDAVVMATV